MRSSNRAVPCAPGLVYDSNARILADAVREQGGEPVPLGIVSDDRDRLRERLWQGLDVGRPGAAVRRHE